MDEMKISEYIDVFIRKEKDNNMHRYKSLNIIHELFSNLLKNKTSISDKDKDLLALNLGMYLASWGMYRGSSVLLREFNYKIHLKAIDVLLKDKYRDLLDIKDFDTLKKNKNVELIGELYFELHKLYVAQFKKIKTKQLTITLIGKIILGTYACLPAYDRFIKQGLKEDNIKISFSTKDKKKCKEDIKKSIEGICNTYSSKYKNQFKLFIEEYPIMKLLDMYLFEKGLEKFNSKKKKYFFLIFKLSF